MKKTQFDPNVLISAAITMQHIQQAVSHGHEYWISGRVPAVKATDFVGKFDALWDLNIDKNRRYRRRQKGEAVFSFYMYPVDNSKELDWILLRTQGTHPEMDRESWFAIDNRNTRLTWRGYELLKLPLTKNEREKYAARNPKLGTTTRTWRMTQQTYEGWKKRIRSEVNRLKRSGGSNNAQYHQLLFSLNRVPGFRGVRRQVFELRQYLNECRKRCKIGPEKFTQPILYMRPRKCSQHALSVLVNRALCNEDSWFPPVHSKLDYQNVTRLHTDR